MDPSVIGALTPSDLEGGHDNLLAARLERLDREIPASLQELSAAVDRRSREIADLRVERALIVGELERRRGRRAAALEEERR